MIRCGGILHWWDAYIQTATINSPILNYYFKRVIISPYIKEKIDKMNNYRK